MKFTELVKSPKATNILSGGLFPLTLFLIIHIARPLLTGLYHDDWYLFTMPNRMPHAEIFPTLYSGFLDRPIFNFILYGAIIFWDGRPETLTLGASVFVGITGLLLYLFLRKLTQLADQNSLAASIGTAFWIAIPWGFGYSLWPIGAMGLLGTIFFLAAAIFAIFFSQAGKLRYAFFYGISIFLSFFSYQSNYFEFVPLLGLLIISLPQNKTLYQRASCLLIVGFAFQITSIAYTKLVSIKTLSLSLKFIFGNFLYALPVAIMDSFGKIWFIPLIIVLVITAALIKGATKFDQKNRKELLLSLLICWLGVAIGTLPYSLAGYMLKGLGVFSRTTITANIWLAILMCMAIIYSRKMESKLTRLIVISSSLLILTFTITSGYQTTSWAESWKRQNQILKIFPVDHLAKMASGSVIILNEPNRIRGVEVFAASWDITSALYETIRPFAPPQRIPPSVIPIRENMTWDGIGVLTIGNGENIKASELWIYTPAKNELRKIVLAGAIN